MGNNIGTTEENNEGILSIGSSSDYVENIIIANNMRLISSPRYQSGTDQIFTDQSTVSIWHDIPKPWCFSDIPNL